MYFSYSSLGKILSFMVKKQLFYFFCSFTLLVCGEKNILPRSRSRVFLAPWSRSRWKKKYQEPEPEPLWKKIRSRSRVKKKSGAGAAKKFAGSPALPKCPLALCYLEIRLRGTVMSLRRFAIKDLEKSLKSKCYSDLCKIKSYYINFKHKNMSYISYRLRLPSPELYACITYKIGLKFM